MSDQDPSEEHLIFLDFNEKLTTELLQNKVFFRVINLEEDPLIQVNDLVFKGTYDYSVGTNLFFQKITNTDPIEFPFKEPILYKLELKHCQTKVLNCKQMKVKSTGTELSNKPDNITFNFNWDYKELLKKFEDDTLDLNDIVANKETENSTDAHIEESIEPDNFIKESILVDNEGKVDTNKPNTLQDQKAPLSQLSDALLLAYNKLQILARTPVKRKMCQEEVECLLEYKDSYNYNSIQCKVLQKPLFFYFQNQENPEIIENHINIDRCVSLGLIKKHDICPRKLTNEELGKVMRLENFENLDLIARYSVLTSIIHALEEEINVNSSDENCRKDEYDRTPVETLNQFRKLICALKLKIQT